MTRDESLKLTLEQKKFCEEYLKSYSPTLAYRKAFNKPKSHSATYAYDLLQRQHVIEYIQELKNELKKPVVVDLEIAILKLQDLAFNDNNPQQIQLKALDTLHKVLDKNNLTLENDGINITISRKD